MKQKKKLLFLLFMYAFLLCMEPTVVQAAESGFKVNVELVRQSDGSTCGELWYNGKIFWRLILLADGAKAVISQQESNTTYIVPEIRNGFFVFTLYDP